MPLTTKEIDNLEIKDKPYLVREAQKNKNDGILAIKILPSGEKDFYFIYYVERKEKQKKLGRYGNPKHGLMTLKDAHAKYAQLSVEYQKGSDIKAEEVKRAEAAKKAELARQAEEKRIRMQGSLGQLIDVYLDHAKQNLSEHYYKSVSRALKYDLSEFDLSTKANAVTKQDIISILHRITERGSLVMANRMRAYLSALFKFGIEFDDTPGTIAQGVQFFIEINPVSTVKKPLKHEQPRERFLNAGEVYAFWQALEKSDISTHRKNALRLMLVTGARLEAISGLKWDEVDTVNKLITIPPERSKNGLFWVIPINDMAADIIANNPKSHDVYLFPAGNGVEPLRTDGFSKAVARLCKQFEIEPFVPRDLRSTWKTLAGIAGLSKEIRDRLQNHALKNDVSMKHYDRYDYLKEKRRAMEIWNNYLRTMVTAEAMPDNVLGFASKVI